MIWLGLYVGAYSISADAQSQLIADLKEKTASYTEAVENFKNAEKKLKKIENSIKNKQKIIDENTILHLELARILSYYDEQVDQLREKYLREKKNPATRAADTIQAVNREKIQLKKEFDMLQSHLIFYETYFPWLSSFLDLPIDVARKYAMEIQADSIITDRIVEHLNFDSQNIDP